MTFPRLCGIIQVNKSPSVLAKSHNLFLASITEIYENYSTVLPKQSGYYFFETVWVDNCYRPPIMSSNRYCILSRRQQFCQGKYTRFWQIHGTTVAQARNAHGKTNAINPSYGYAATKNRKRHRSDSNFGMMPSVFCR